MNNYQKSIEQIEKELNTSRVHGLSSDQVILKRQQDGFNELKETKKESLFVKFLKEFKDPLILILLAAAIISVIVEPGEWVESLIILIVVLLNAVLGVYQEDRAEKSLEALKKLSSPHAKVIRDGKKITIPSKEVCIGDLLVVDAGDLIVSDARVIESASLQIDESALTGESLAVEKVDTPINKEECPLGDQKNMVFASTMCTYGRGLAIVTSIGMDNETGKIAAMLQAKDENMTPLQIKLAQISKVIGIMCIVICIAVFGMEMMTGMSMLEAFKTAIALAVAAIPEGLATVVTIVLSIGVSKMVKHNAIIRKLPAVETLGSCNVICSDKTGTLTQNKMTLTNVYTKKEGYQDFNVNCDDEVKNLVRLFSLCSDGDIVVENDGTYKSIGDPTETSVVYALYQLGETKDELASQYKRVNEIAFDSDRKMMSVFMEHQGKILQITKGAPDVILDRCVGDNTDVAKINDQMAESALRVLAVAINYHKELPEKLDSNELEKNMTFVGLVGMIDPPRLEVKEAISSARTGGVKTVMITGDHLTTASAIAKELGILEEDSLAITGEELNQMSDEELEEKVDRIRVYARVAPEHKVRVVNAFQKRGQVVAMTGDGVNDSPALKKADIGCAMGITGTDVSKNASDMILVDDNFSTIIQAIKQGRGIYANIKKDVHFLLSTNIGEVVTIFSASLIGLVSGIAIGVPFMPMHLLWINLITDTLPAFALGLEPVDENVMEEKPRKKDESFFAQGLGFRIIYQGILIGLIALASYLIGNRESHEIGMTMAFITLVLTQLIHAFNIKSEKSIFNKQIFNNKYLWLAFVVGIGLQLCVIYIPFLANIFDLVPLDLRHVLISIGLSLIMLIVSEIVKLVKRNR